MSGGIAYVWNPAGDFHGLCNPEMVELEALESKSDLAEVRGLIERHLALTGSNVAGAVLDDWRRSVRQFVKVMPVDYKRVLAERKTAVAAG